VTERTLRLTQERVYDPPRGVEVEQDGHWSPALQRSWQLWDDDRGWVAQVEYTVCYHWGVRTRVDMVPADRLRLARRPAAHPSREQADALTASRS
jgi:hypothetical protein